MVVTKNNYVKPEIDLMYFSEDVVLASVDNPDDFDNIGRVNSDWLGEE